MKSKKRFITLTDIQQTALKREWKKGKSSAFRQRCHYLLLSAQGKQIGEICAIYQVTYQAVLNWFNRYQKHGLPGLHTQKGQGRSAIVRIDNQNEIKQIEDLVEKNPQNLKVVLAQIKQQIGKQMSKKTLQRLLKKRLGLETV